MSDRERTPPPPPPPPEERIEKRWVPLHDDAPSDTLPPPEPPPDTGESDGSDEVRQSHAEPSSVTRSTTGCCSRRGGGCATTSRESAS